MIKVFLDNNMKCGIVLNANELHLHLELFCYCHFESVDKFLFERIIYVRAFNTCN